MTLMQLLIQNVTQRGYKLQEKEVIWGLRRSATVLTGTINRSQESNKDTWKYTGFGDACVSVTVPDNATVEPGAIIESGVEINKGVTVQSGAVVEENVILNKNTTWATTLLSGKTPKSSKMSGWLFRGAAPWWRMAR